MWRYGGVVSRMQARLARLRDEVADLKACIEAAWSHIYCIGGPLNDNKLGYSRPQMLSSCGLLRRLGKAWKEKP